jgi:hypothetical protein
MEERGYFIFSLDTELATGQFDRDQARHRLFSPDGSREREAIYRLIDLLEQFDVAGTWAVVGHLFYKACEDCAICPLRDWSGKYSSFEEAYKTSSPLWYGDDVIDALVRRGARQEIAFHGYSHRIFDEDLMSPEAARVEVQEWLRVGARKGIVPASVTFPRNRAGHLDILREAGLVCYRGEPATPPLFKHGYAGKLMKTMGKLTGLSRVPIFDLTCRESGGLVVLQPSEYLFDINRKLELFLDSVALHNLRINRIVAGVKRAAREKKMIHIWAHPCDFRTEKDFAKLRRILVAVSNEVKRGRMRSVGMAEMAGLLTQRNAV